MPSLSKAALTIDAPIVRRLDLHQPFVAFGAGKWFAP